MFHMFKDEPVELSIGLDAVEKIRAAAKTRPAAAKEFALSLTYLRHLKRRYSTPKLALLGSAAAFGVVSPIFPDLVKLALVSLLFWILIKAKELLVAYRIQKGLFGTNRTEARDLINFIVENSSDIDFTDSGGKLRRALLPEESKARDPAPGTGHGGVTA